MNENEKILRLAISFFKKLNFKNLQSLISYTGSLEEIFKLNETSLNEIPNLNPIFISEFKNQISICLEKAKRELEYIEKNNIQIHFYTDKTFPKRLLECNDCPKLLYSKGVADLNKYKFLGIVGTRNASDYGKHTCKKIIRELANTQPKICIISGLAYGIDITAHRAAIEYNIPTIGVIGSGFSNFYPKSHYNTSVIMEKNGAVITEFPHNTFPEGFNFVQRNRIIAGMSDGLLVIESANKGGSLITAELAYSYNRDVMAVPGRSIDEFSLGCNSLIKCNKASLVENSKDIERVMCWDACTNLSIDSELFPTLSEKESKIVDIIRSKSSVHIDIIAEISELNIAEVSSILLGLEFKNVVRSTPGCIYKLD